MPRDFAKAAEIYDKDCAGGAGDPVACRKLVLAVDAARGQARDRVIDAWGLLTRACSGGDWIACATPHVIVHDERVHAACESGKPAACFAETARTPSSQSGTVEDAKRTLLGRACDGGTLEACIQLLNEDHRRGTHEASRATPPVTIACREGDVDACAAIGQPIAPAALCAANDYEACAKIGAVGDDDALERACNHAVLDACERLAFKARDAEPPDPHLGARFVRACQLGSEVACRQNRPAEVANGCAAYDPFRFPQTRRPKLPVLRGSEANGRSWTATPGRAFVLFTKDPATPWQTYADVATRLRDVASVYVLVDLRQSVDAIVPAVGVVLEPLLATTALDGSLGGTLIGDATTKVVDAAGAVHAVLSLESGITPATLARCAISLLAE